MITRHILAIAAVSLLPLATLQAQTPAATPAGGTPGATPAAGTPAAAPGAAPTTPAAKPKPLSTNDAKFLTDLLEAMQFHIRMGEVAKHNKDDKDLVAFGSKNHKEMTEEFTPMVTLAQNNQIKNIPTEASKADKGDIAKLSKAKAEKWKLEYFELLAKNGKRNVRMAENALKSMNDATVKAAATKVAGLMASQTTAAEAKVKELKEKK
jgi:hypothetical protein